MAGPAKCVQLITNSAGVITKEAANSMERYDPDTKYWETVALDTGLDLNLHAFCMIAL